MNVSVIIPAYNAEQTIAECLLAIKVQSVKAKEIIVIDDGSTDYTKREVQKITGIKYYCQANKGPAVARNVGAKRAKGELILFTDSDCITDENWIKEMTKPFENKKVSGVQGAYKTKQKELVARFGQIEIEHRYERMKKQKEIDWVGSYSAGFRRKEFLELGGYDESFPIASGEDPEFSFRVAKEKGKLVFNPKAIVYHTHPKGILKYLRAKFNRAYFRPKMYSKHKEKAVNDSYTPQSLKLQIVCFYLMVAGLIAGFFDILGVFVLISALLAHILLGLGFFVFAAKRDLAVAIISPIILLLRSMVFGIGLFWGKLNG